jgi:hypothetical protein
MAVALAAPALAQDNAPPAGPSAAQPKKPAKPPKSAEHKPADGTGTAAAAGGAKPTLLGQYGEWGAYTAAPGGKRICFIIAKPSSSETTPPNRPRNPPYMFISTRPTDKVMNEVSVIIGYAFKPNGDATVEIGDASYALYTQQDGAWIKNTAEETRLVEAMRAGQSAVVKGASAKGTKTTDIFPLKGFSQALDRSDQACNK